MAAEPEQRRDRSRRRRVVLATAIVTALLLITLAIFVVPGIVRTQEVKAAYATHLKNIESENLTAVLGGYEPNATVEFTGTSFGLRGTYEGIAAIHVLYHDLLPIGGGEASLPIFFRTLNLTYVNYTVSMTGNGRQATVNSAFTMYGNCIVLRSNQGPVFDTYNASVSSGVSFVRVGNTWLIAHEAWDFVTFDLSK